MKRLFLILAFVVLPAVVTNRAVVYAMARFKTIPASATPFNCVLEAADCDIGWNPVSKRFYYAYLLACQPGYGTDCRYRQVFILFDHATGIVWSNGGPGTWLNCDDMLMVDANFPPPVTLKHGHVYELYFKIADLINGGYVYQGTTGTFLYP